MSRLPLLVSRDSKRRDVGCDQQSQPGLTTDRSQSRTGALLYTVQFEIFVARRSCFFDTP